MIVRYASVNDIARFQNVATLTRGCAWPGENCETAIAAGLAEDILRCSILTGN